MDAQAGSQMYTQFANAYPVVLKYITQQVSFNRKAFEKFFRGQIAKPGEGMTGFIEHQANYAKLLYIEASKAAGKHYSIKKANKLKNVEYQQMDKIRKDIEQSRKKAENEFESESANHMDERKKELLDFINLELEDHGMPTTGEYSDDSDSDSESESLEEPTPEPEKMMTDEEWWEQATDNERIGKIKTLKFLEGVLKDEIAERKEITKMLLEKKKKQELAEKRRKEAVKQSFLPDNMRKNKKKKKTKKR